MWIDPRTLTVFKLHHEIRVAFPQTSLPLVLNDSLIESLGLFPVQPSDKPEGYVVQEEAPTFIDGVWVQQWLVRPPTDQETLDKSVEVRALRNKMLQDSDWTQAVDAPVDQVTWATYRQALRDITVQQQFPWEVTWPEAPQ